MPRLLQRVTRFHMLQWTLVFVKFLANLNSIEAAKFSKNLPPPLIPRKVMFAPPDYSSLELSPDGQWLSWIAYVNDTPNVWLRNIPNGKPFQLTSESGRG